MKLSNLLSNHSVVAVAGNRSTGKTSLVLYHLLELKKRYPKLKISVMGVESSLHSLMKERGIGLLHSKMDILDLRMRDTIIYVAEFALFFDTTSRNKQIGKLMRFFDRIEHNNCKLIIDTAREGYYNKFFCSRVTSFMVKQIEYEALVNGTWIKERVKAIESSSDYRLECDKGSYYVVASDSITEKHKFPYVKEIDSKKNNITLFSEQKDETKGEKKGAKKENKKEEKR